MIEEDIEARVRAFVDRKPDLISSLTAQARSMPRRVFWSTEDYRQFLDIYFEEAQYALDLASPHLFPGARVLEVGGGLGLFHVMASAAGADMTSIEPGQDGFSLFRPFAVPLVAEFTGRSDRFVDAYGEEIPWPDDGFDLVVSNNVLEHVTDPERVLTEMYRVTRPGGLVLVSCPNYLMPYEPHYKVPMLPGAPRLTGRLIWRSFRNDPMWRSLNWITAIGVRRIVHQLPGAQLKFRRGLAIALDRLAVGGPLRARHGMMADLVLTRPVRALLSALPAMFTSPMVFEIRKATP